MKQPLLTLTNRLIDRIAGGYRGRVSDHFDGRRFHNARPSTHSAGDLLRWWRNRENQPWQRVEHFAPPPAPPQRVDDGLRITWINHATVLIQTAGLNLLADPIFSERASPLSWAGPRRYHPPGVAFNDLPPIDIVAISHAHYDHLDRASVARLVARFDPHFVVPLGVDGYLARFGAQRITCGDWWQDVELNDRLRLTVTPAQHWSRRGLLDRNRSLWAGFWFDTPAGAVYFAGDTGMGPHFGTIRERLGAPRVALLPIGAYEPRWFMAQQHMNPADAVDAHQILDAQQSIGIHFATFKLTDEGQAEPARALARARDAAGLNTDRFIVPTFGQALAIAPVAHKTG
ncbi:hypothetical protein S4A8_13184 [Salinisphaera sp. S4-8]|uniref:MBL fold metallo-hydrolase n=1 Tax=Salinisphaera sp. S4-8 TaxID=633357 RepID=UPI00334165B5